MDKWLSVGYRVMVLAWYVPSCCWQRQGNMQLHFAGVVKTKVLDLWFALLSSLNLYFICLRKNLHPTRLQMQITTFVLSVGTR